MNGEAPLHLGGTASSSKECFRFGPFELDARSGLLYQGDREILLPFRAVKVLEVLLCRQGEVLPKDELLAEVWQDAFVGEDSLTQAISMVRSALGDDPRDPTYIQTIPKRGYRFIAEVEVGGAAAAGATETSGVSRSAAGSEALASEAIPVIGAATSPTAPPATPRGAGPLPLVSVGSSLGHFEILGELGAGAMGVVYRARDTVLEREVAIKVLPEDFVSDPDRVARFEREARLLAAVSHPNIAGIHSLEEDDGAKFPVMELVEGETLEQRLRSGRIGVEEALELGRQIASALEAAHERGIVHRDLKPANIKIAPNGQIKVLDFGLAKALEVKIFEGSAADSPTASMTIMGSRRGSIVGTAAYMSPEQARGQEADKRADIWSFGCVLYEMLTGKRAFGGETVSDTIAKLLEREPDWEALPSETPRAARRVLRRCLSKDPDHRLHDIADARIELEEAASEPTTDEVPKADARATPTPFWLRRRIWWGAAGVTAGVVLTVFVVWGLLGWGSGPVSQADTVKLNLGLPAEISISPRNGNLQVAISPDGSTILFVGRQEGVRRLYQRPLDQLSDPRPLRGTEGARYPFFSPDSQWAGFFADGQLKRVRLDGEAPQILCDAPNSYGGTWGPDGTIVFNPDTLRGLWEVPETGGTPELILPPDPRNGVFSYEKPSFLPGGESLLVGIYLGGHGTWNLGVLDLHTGEPEVLIEGTSYGVYVPTGHILFGRPDGVYAVEFDLETNELRGPEVPVFRHVGFSVMDRLAQFTVSQTGTLVYMPSMGMPRSELVRVDFDGRATALPAEARNYVYPRFSPNGDKIAVNVVEADTNVWIVDVETGALTKLTSEGSNEFPAWTPDGRHVTFASIRSEPQSTGIYRKLAGGSGAEELIFRPDNAEHGDLTPNQWSPDGHSLAGQGNVGWPDDPEPMFGIAYLVMEHPPKLTTLVPPVPNALMHGAAFSHDGKWVAYVSNETGTQNVYVTPFPGPGARQPISPGGGNQPLWSPDGRRLYYYSYSSTQMMVVDVTEEPEFRASSPRVLFDYSGYDYGYFYSHPDFDIAPDGESFVMVRQAEESVPRPSHLNVALNWFGELEELMHTER